MAHIFISYSHKDTAYVEKLEKKLIDEGFDVWVDHRIDYGSRWTKEIEKAIDTCDAYVIVMSKDSAESQWVERERIHAERRRKPFFPLLLSGDGWFSLGNIQFVDVRGGKLPPKDYYEDIAKFVPRKVNPASIGAGVQENAPSKKNLSIWIGGVVVFGLLVMGGFALRNIFRDPEPPVQIDVDPTDVTAFPVTMPVEPEPVDIQLTPPADAQLGDTWTRPTDGMGMSYIPAGEFEMGSEDGEANAQPIHAVYLDAFWMDQTEVTNAMYAECVFNGRCESPSDTTYLDDPAYANHPVVYVTWQDAQNYCERVGGRLPTEAEWEKAARGIDGRTYPWGEGVSCLNSNFRDCVGMTTVVGTYQNGKSPYGLYDMAGNVWEWVKDKYNETYYANSPSLNPVETANSADSRVVRSGSWNNHIDQTRSWERNFYVPEFYDNDIGFRCARSATE